MDLVLFSLPELPYEYDELEPIISAEIMQLHHQKHHQAYVTNLNNAMDKLNESSAQQELTSIINLNPIIRFNGGGHINHSLFWEVLAPPSKGGGVPPKHELLKGIEKFWGSYDNFLKKFVEFATPIQGSGWAWLAYDSKNKTISLQSTANQDPLEATTGLIPLLGVDVWEHAYYLQYKNARADYLKAINQIINWNYIENRFIEITHKKDGF